MSRNYTNDYKGNVEIVHLPKTIDDNYVVNRQRKDINEDSFTTEFSWALCGQDVSQINMDELSEDNFSKLSFDENTTFSEKQIEKFNPYEILKNGKSFGLGIERLHKAGINGQGINVGIIDEPFDVNHEEFKNTDLAYDDSNMDEESKCIDNVHGKTVTSLLSQIVPKAKIYFFTSEYIYSEEINNQASKKHDDERIAIIERIKKEYNLDVLSLSSAISIQNNTQEYNQKYTEELEAINCAYIDSINFFKGFDYGNRNNILDINDPENIERIERISVITNDQVLKNEYANLRTKARNKIISLTEKLINCSEEEKIKLGEELENATLFANMTFEEVKDFYEKRIKNKKETTDNKVLIPSGGRTYANIGEGYKYCGEGSASWSIPQISALFAISKQMDKNITYDEFMEICSMTCSINSKKIKVINPEAIVREINERNKSKAKDDNEYIEIYEKSSKLIINLNKVIDPRDEFISNLKSNVQCDSNISNNEIQKKYVGDIEKQTI